LVDVIDDIIVIKKMNQQFSKAEIKKIQTNTIVIDKDNSLELIEDRDEESAVTNNENDYNPLRDVF
jgi:aspartate 1-decarboxylase